MNSLVLAGCLITLLSQAETPKTTAAASEEKKQSARRLTLMKEAATLYRMTLDNQPRTQLKLKSEPVLRWANPVSGVKDGTVFIWTAGGRPVVAAQIFLNRDRWWVHEFQWLSATPLTAEMNNRRFWYPATGGVTMKPVPSGPTPAKTAVGRLRQIRMIAKTFRAAVKFKVDDRDKTTSRYQLRLMSKPVHRYGTDDDTVQDDTVQDGALLAFVIGTDPEVWLRLEARTGDKGYQWHYGLAPMTGYAVEAWYDGKKVWDSPAQTRPKKPKSSYWIHSFPPTKPAAQSP